MPRRKPAPALQDIPITALAQAKKTTVFGEREAPGRAVWHVGVEFQQHKVTLCGLYIEDWFWSKTEPRPCRNCARFIPAVHEAIRALMEAGAIR